MYCIPTSALPCLPCSYHLNLNILLGKMRAAGGAIKWADVNALKAELEAQARWLGLALQGVGLLVPRRQCCCCRLLPPPPLRVHCAAPFPLAAAHHCCMLHAVHVLGALPVMPCLFLIYN